MKNIVLAFIKKHAMLLLAAGLLFLLASCGSQAVPRFGNTAVTRHGVAHTEAGPLPGEVSGDWKLLLVNDAHMLPHGYAVSTRSLPNGQSMDERAFPFLEQMLEAARAAGLQPVVCSSYRSMDDQKRLYQNKVRQYKNDGYSEKEAMAQAAKWVAPPGTSEHQAGLSVDIVDYNNQNLDASQEQTATSIWLKENCASFGFIVRYPPEKSKITGVHYEPWHYRYVGAKAAHAIMQQGITLEEYLNAA